MTRKISAPRIEIAFAADNADGPYRAALLLYVQDGHEPETLPLFNGKRLSQKEATHAILQIYTALSEQFQHADFDIADSPVRPPLS